VRASRYVSYLAAEIEPQAINTLNKFESEATRVLDRIAAAAAKSSGLGSFGAGSSRGLVQLSQNGARARAELDKVTASTVKAHTGAERLASGFTHVATSLAVVQGPLGPIAGRLSALGSILRTMTGFSLAGVLAGGGAFALGNIATGYQQVHDRLAPLYESQKDLNGALTNVIGIAQRTRQALGPVADLYAKLALAGRAAGISDARSARIAEIASKAATISGGTAETKEAGLTQFAQGFGSGSLAGDELKSIKENTLSLAKAIADGLGVPIAALKNLGAQGKLTPQLIAQALERSAASIDAQFAKLPQRIGTSLTNLENQLAVFVGKTDEATGATSKIAAGINLIGNNLDKVVLIAGTVTAAFGAQMFTGAIQGAAAYIGRLAAIAPLTNEQIQLNQIFKATIAERAQAEVTAIAAEIQSNQAYRAQLVANIALIEKQILAQEQALETARLLDAASRSQGGGGRSDLVKAATIDLNNSKRALIATDEALVAVETELTGAEGRLAAATQAAVVATDESVAADTAAAASTSRLTVAKTVLAGVITRVTTAASGLVQFLGGSWGVAFTLAAGLALLLATNTNKAAEAARQFEGDQDALAKTLGFTTNELYKQTDAARALAIELARTNLLKAKQNFGEIAGDAASAIGNKAFAIPFGVQDAARLQQFRSLLLKGQTLNEKGFAELAGIIRKYPQLSGDLVLRESVLGLRGANSQIAKAIDDANQTVTELAKPRTKLPPLIATGGKPETAAQRRARLNREAMIDGTSGLAKARAELAAAKAEGPKSGESDEQYIARIAQMKESVDGLAASQRASSKAAREAEAARKREAVAVETASDKADKLANILDRYTEDTPNKRLEKLKDDANKAKRAIDDLIGERVEGYKGVFTQADADRAKAKIDAGVARDARRPLTDTLDDQKHANDMLLLQAKGEGDLARLVEQRYNLEKQIGPLKEAEISDLAGQIVRENQINDLMEKRNAIIDNNAQFLGKVRDAGRDAIRAFLGGDIKGGIKNLVNNVKNAFLDAKANEIAIKLFGDPEKKYRDEMTRGLNNSASKLTDSATVLQKAGDALDSAADALTRSATAPVATADGVTTPGQALGSIVGSLGGVDDSLSDLSRTLGTAAQDSSQFDNNPVITVTGMRPPKVDMPAGIDSVIGNLFKGSNLSSIASMASGIVQSIFGNAGGPGTKGDKLSSTLGGIAQLAGQVVPQLGIAMAATSAISSVLGLPNFAGGILGVGGNFIAKLLGFGKKKTGSATITDLSGNFKTSGNTGSYKDAAKGSASSVVAGLQNILDTLGGTLGSFAVSIGMKKDKYVVDVLGKGRLKSGDKNTPEFKTEEEAVRFAILDALKDGAIQGLHQGALNLLKAGKDLDAALDKALKFENVFRELKAIKDPVGAAVDDLNRQFTNLISIFKEAGASSDEFASLQELYDLKRADAIKQATDAAVQALDQFISGLTAGPDSPLSRRTVYENAKAAVDTFRSDILAGKTVDQDKLIAALDNMQQASSTLFGSRSQFFADFNDILALAQQARANVPITTDANLPASPFDALNTTGQQQVVEQQTTNDLLGQILNTLQHPPAGSVAAGSTIGNLPFALPAGLNQPAITNAPNLSGDSRLITA
jgi:tape measure domain-containing protein